MLLFCYVIFTNLTRMVEGRVFFCYNTMMLKHKDTIINVGLAFVAMGVLVVLGGNSTENNDAYRGLGGSVIIATHDPNSSHEIFFSPPIASTASFNSPSIGSTASFNSPSIGSTASFNSPSIASTASFNSPSIASTASFNSPSIGSTASFNSPSIGSTSSYDSVSIASASSYNSVSITSASSFNSQQSSARSSTQVSSFQFSSTASTGTAGGTTGGTNGGTSGGTQGGGTFGGFGITGGFNGGTFGGGTVGGGIIGGSGGGESTTGGGGGASGKPKKTAEPAEKGACKTGDPCVPLLAPLGDLDRIKIEGGSGGAAGAVLTFINYFNNAWGLLRVISVGFCVLWILIGSFFILISGSDGGKRSTGKGIITWAIIGLIIVEFSGFFLRTLNDIFFV
jgi:hypothetical protein